MNGSFYSIPTRSRLTIHGRRWLVTAVGDDGYDAENLDDGECCTLGFAYVDRAIRANHCIVEKPSDLEMREALRNYTGGFEALEQLPEPQIETVRARLALVLAIETVFAEGRRVTQRRLDAGPLRKLVIKRARELSNGLVGEGRGGRVAPRLVAPKGRTLLGYYRRYLAYGKNPMVLADRDHSKGPRSKRLCPVGERFIAYVIAQMLEARQPKLSSVYNTACAVFDVPRDAQAAGFRFPSVVTVRTRWNAVAKSQKQIGLRGFDNAYNACQAGQTDTRALMVGERCETDQLLLAVFVGKAGAMSARRIADDEPSAENELIRLWLHVTIDVATRLPLAWVLGESADAEHSISMLRMALRDKTREKVRYGCKADPAPPVAIGTLVADNGTAIRNADFYPRMLGLGINALPGRARRANDKPYIERLFGTLNDQLINFQPGYAGNRPGHLEGYNPQKSAKLAADELYGMITRFFVDEYPHQPHHGTSMFGATPWEKLEETRRKYGGLTPPSADWRREHLGVARQSAITKQGVRFFGLPYNSTALQALAQTHSRVTVRVDPDFIGIADIIAEGERETVQARLSMTALQDLSLEEAVDVMAAAAQGNPHERQITNAQLTSARKRKATDTGFFADPAEPASYRKLEELARKADRMAAVEILPDEGGGFTVPPGSVTRREPKPSQETSAAPELLATQTPKRLSKVKESKL